MTDKQINDFYDVCCTCKKQKPNMPKARCQIYHAVCVQKSPTALDNIHLFLNPGGTCKEYVPKGDSDDEVQGNRQASKRQVPSSWR